MSLPNTTARSRVWTPGRFSIGVFSTPNVFDATRPRPMADHDYLHLTFATGALPTRTTTCAICQEDIKANNDTIMHRYSRSQFDPPGLSPVDRGIDKCCDNAFHQQCFKDWCAATQKGSTAIKCPYCRGKMPWRAQYSQSWLKGEFPWGEKIFEASHTQQSNQALESEATSRAAPSAAMPPTRYQSETPSVSAPTSDRYEYYSRPTPYYPPPPMLYPSIDSPRQSADSTRTSQATSSPRPDEGIHSSRTSSDSGLSEPDDLPTLPRSESPRLVDEDISDESARAMLDNLFLGIRPTRPPAIRREGISTTDFVRDELPPSTSIHEPRPHSNTIPIYLFINLVYPNDHVEDVTINTTGITRSRVAAVMEVARHTISGSYSIGQHRTGEQRVSRSDWSHMAQVCVWADSALRRQMKLVYGEDEEVVRGEDGVLRVQRIRDRDHLDEQQDAGGEAGGVVVDGESERGSNREEDDMGETEGGQATEAMEIIRDGQRSIDRIGDLRRRMQGIIQSFDDEDSGLRARESEARYE